VQYSLKHIAKMLYQFKQWVCRYPLHLWFL